MHIAYENLCVDKDGNPRPVAEKELLDWINKGQDGKPISRSTLRDYFRIAQDNEWTELKRKSGRKSGTDSLYSMEGGEGYE